MMRLSRIHIDGFGLFHNFTFEDIPPGLSLVLGNNETGKSTFLAFLRSILFGFPRSLKKNFYPPLQGGQKGGRLVLLRDESERYIVERYDDKGTGRLRVIFPDGSEGSEDTLPQLIGTASPDLFQNIFAFSLNELQEFESLQTEKVRDAIYSAGIGTGRVAIPQVLEGLVKAKEKLFTRRGQREINCLLSQLDELHQRIQKHKKDQDEYDIGWGLLVEKETNLAGLEKELKEARKRQERLRLLQQAWSDWTALGRANQDLDELPSVETFPEDGLRRLDKLIVEKRGIAEQIEEIQADKEDIKNRLEAIRIDEAVLQAGGRIRQLERGLEGFEQERQELQKLRGEHKRAEESLSLALKDLGPEWNEARLLEFDLSVPVREQIRGYRRRLEEAGDRIRINKTRLENEEHLLKEARENEAQARTDVDNRSRPSANLDEAGIKNLLLERQHYESTCRDVPLIRKQYEASLADLHETLQQIGPDWNEEKLRSFDTSLAVRDEVRSHQNTLSKAGLEVQNSSRILEEANEELQEARAAQTRAEEHLASLPEPKIKDEAILSERRRGLRLLRSLLNRRDQETERLGHLDERRRDLQARSAWLEEQAQNLPQGLPVWLGPAVFLVGLAAMTGIGLARGDWITGGIVVGVCSLLAGLLHILCSKAEQRNRKQAQSLNKERAAIVSHLSELDREAALTHQRLSNLQAQIQQQVESLELQGEGIELLLVEGAEAETERMLEELQQWAPARDKVEESRQRVLRANEAVAEAKQAAEQAGQKHEQAKQNWQSWLEQAGLQSSLSTESAVAVMAGLSAAREKLRAVEGFRERMEQINEAIQGYEDRVQAVLVGSGFDPVSAEKRGEAVGFLAAELERLQKERRDWEEASRKLAETIQQREKAENKVDEAKRLFRESQEAYGREMEDWRKLLQSRGLRDSLTLDGALEMLQRIERTRDILDKLNEFRERERLSEESIVGYWQEVSEVCRATGRAEIDERAAAAAVDALAAELDKTERLKRTSNDLKERWEEISRRLNLLQGRLTQRDDEYRGLLEAGETSSEEEFRRRAAYYEQRRKLQEQIHNYETRLRRLGGIGEALTTFKNELAGVTSEELADEWQELEDRLAALEGDREKLIDERGRLKEQLDHLEASEEISQLRIEQQAVQSELKAAAHEWSVLRLSEFLIEKARRKYERERRPAVLKQAEHYFSRFTGGRYAEVIAPPGEKRVRVIASSGEIRDIEQLSRGTAEQLYLSLRFGFVQEFTKRSEALPLIFDDILVNFDPYRAKAAVQAILELAQSHQVFLFTCHPQTVDIVREVDGSVPVFKLLEGKMGNEIFS